MKHLALRRLPAFAAVAFLLGLPVAQAGSSASSAASDSASTSVGSLSGSVQQSSESSTPDRRVSDGDYRILEVAAIEREPGQVRLRLLAVGRDAAEADRFELMLPRQLLQDHPGLVAGAVLGARNRPYGVEFSQGEPRRAFFLALRDEWHDELRSVPVTL